MVQEGAAAIRLVQLRKQYRGAFMPAIDGFNLEVKPNTIVGLLGPNGAGKTSSINVLCGLLVQDEGEASIFGYDCRKDQDVIRRRLGVVPQQIALFSTLTGWENFIYIGRMYGISDTIIRKRASALLGRLGLEKHANKQVRRYSGGMKRRANMLASILHEPDLLILDEPTAGVDVQSRAMILDFLRDYRKEGKTILYTSHMLEEAEQLCDEVTIIDEGKNVVDGKPHDLVQNTPGSRRLEDVFLHYTGHSVRD